MAPINESKEKWPFRSKQQGDKDEDGRVAIVVNGAMDWTILVVLKSWKAVKMEQTINPAAVIVNVRHVFTRSPRIRCDRSVAVLYDPNGMLGSAFNDLTRPLGDWSLLPVESLRCFPPASKVYLTLAYRSNHLSPISIHTYYYCTYSVWSFTACLADPWGNRLILSWSKATGPGDDRSPLNTHCMIDGVLWYCRRIQNNTRFC